MTVLRAWYRRLAALFGADHHDRELAAELESHVQMHVDDNFRSGMTMREARRQALLKLGGIEQTKERYRERRGVPWLDNLLQDVRFGLRMLRKNPGFTIAVVATLAIGIAASTVVFSVYYNLMFNAFAAKDSSRLVIPAIQDGGQLITSLSDLDLIRQQNQVFEDVVGYTNGFALLRDGLQTFQFYSSTVTANAFEFYGVPPLLGRGILPEDGARGAPPVFAISYKAWKSSFNGDPTVLGKSYVVNGEPRTLVGVMPRRFQAYGVLAQIWMPIQSSPGIATSDQGLRLSLMARLRPGVTEESASANLDLVMKQLAILHPNDFPKRFAIRVLRANEFLMESAGAVFRSRITLRLMIYGLLASVMALLLIACGNVANLLLTRATAREREMAIRSAVGATRRRIIQQLLTESIVLGAAACVAGCILAWIGMTGVEAVTQQKAWIPIVGGEVVIGLNPPVLMFVLLVTLVTMLTSGLAPALHLAFENLEPHLAGSGKEPGSAARHGRLRSILVVGEVALSIVLLVCAGLMFRSFLLLKHISLGFDPKNVLVVYFAPPNDELPDMTKATSSHEQATRREVVERLKTLPGVADVTVQDALPGYNGGWPSQMIAPGSTHAEAGSLDGADENLSQTLGFQVIQGRWLSRDDVQSAQLVTVINQRLARDFFGDQNPVGRQIEVKVPGNPIRPSLDSYFQIAGVVADVKNFGPQQAATPMAFIPNTIRGSFMVLLKTKVEPASLVRAVEEQIWAVDRDEIVGICDPLEDFFQQHTYATPEFSVMISAPLAGIGLLLAVIGVFSVMAYTVALQTHDIGIRMAVGAQKRDILQAVLGKGLALIAIGTIVGLCASFGLLRFLASQIWGISTNDPWTIGVVVAVIAIAGLVACWIPAMRAVRVDPIVALRYE